MNDDVLGKCFAVVIGVHIAMAFWIGVAAFHMMHGALVFCNVTNIELLMYTPSLFGVMLWWVFNFTIIEFLADRVM